MASVTKIEKCETKKMLMELYQLWVTMIPT